MEYEELSDAAEAPFAAIEAVRGRSGAFLRMAPTECAPAEGGAPSLPEKRDDPSALCRIDGVRAALRLATEVTDAACPAPERGGWATGFCRMEFLRLMEKDRASAVALRSPRSLLSP